MSTPWQAWGIPTIALAAFLLLSFCTYFEKRKNRRTKYRLETMNNRAVGRTMPSTGQLGVFTVPSFQTIDMISGCAHHGHLDPTCPTTDTDCQPGIGHIGHCSSSTHHNTGTEHSSVWHNSSHNTGGHHSYHDSGPSYSTHDTGGGCSGGGFDSGGGCSSGGCDSGGGGGGGY